MANLKDDLAKLIGDYTNSEAPLYHQLTSKLESGVTLSLKGPQLSSVITDPMQGLYFLDIISEGLISVGYSEAINHNIKLNFFEDDRIEYKIVQKDKTWISCKTNLNEYSAFEITKTPPNTTEGRNVSYQVFLKLIKKGQFRLDYENKLDNPAAQANEIIHDIVKDVVGTINSNLFHYPAKAKTVKSRLLLWGIEAKNKKEVLTKGQSLTTSDFGIKDVVALFYLKDLILKDNLNNQALMEQLTRVIKARKKFFEDLCLKLK